MASKGINKVILIGNVGNIDARSMPDGRAITAISLATSDNYKDKSGQLINNTEWHRVVVIGKTAEIAAQYLKKGSQVYFEGKLATKKWQDKSGATRYTTEVIVDSFSGVMQMLGGTKQAKPFCSLYPMKPTTNSDAKHQAKQEPMDGFQVTNTTISTADDDEYPF